MSPNSATDKLIAPLFCTTNEKSAQNNFIKSVDMNSSASMPPSPTINDDVGLKSSRNLSKPSVRFSALPLTSIATNEFFLRSMKSTSSLRFPSCCSVQGFGQLSSSLKPKQRLMPEHCLPNKTDMASPSLSGPASRQLISLSDGLPSRLE